MIKVGEAIQVIIIIFKALHFQSKWLSGLWTVLACAIPAAEIRGVGEREGQREEGKEDAE